MKKNILLFTIGNINHASSRIRGFQYIPLLEKDNYNIFHVSRVPNIKRNSLVNKLLFFSIKKYKIIKRVLLLLFVKNKLVIVQKLFLTKIELFLIKFLKIKYIYDFDDAIQTQGENQYKKTTALITHASCVFAANKILYNYSKKYNNKTVIVPTPIDSDIIRPNSNKKENKEIIIGWIGSPWTQHYLGIIDNALIALNKKGCNIKLITVGTDSNLILKYNNTEHNDWYLDCEKHYLPQFDIGVMPLLNDEFSKGKSAYKLLLYMAAGLANISSPVGLNKDVVIKNKTGILAKSEEDWIQAIELLITNPEIRISYGYESRKIIEKQFSRTIVYSKILTQLSKLL